MKKIKSKEVKKPNAFLYYGVAPFLKIYYRLAYGLKVDRSGLAGLKPPYLVVAGHSCWLDYIITGVAMFPVRMNYVGAYNFYRDKTLAFVFKYLGVISKYQYTKDVSSIKKMKYCIDNGRVVALFPHGCLSNDGRPGGYAVTGVAKLVKFLDVPVVAVKTDGGYLTRPRWSQRSRYGRLETRVSQILSRDDVRELSNEQIYNRMMGALYYDDYRWQRERMIPFRAKKAAEGVEFVLYKCPKCMGEFTLRSEGSRLFCKACGNEVLMNRYLMFEPGGPDTVFFDGIDRWYDFQKEFLEREIEDPGFSLTAAAELRYNEAGKYGYQLQGGGELRITREAITYDGTVKGERSLLVFPMKNIPMIPFAAGEYIEVADGGHISRFIFGDRTQMIKWVMAVRLIRDKYYEETVWDEKTE
ncbi:MAG: lysophospholipid acyltransferase family protein [Clostridia bacterium]